MPTLRITWLLVVAASVFAAPAAAQQAVLRVGSKLRIIAPSVTRGWLDARLVRLDHDTLVVETQTFRWRYLSLPLSAISRLEVRADPRVQAPSPRATGAAIGGTAGALMGAVASDDEDCFLNLGCLVIPVLGAAVGAAIGGTAGAMAGGAAAAGQPWVLVPVEQLAGATITTAPEPDPDPARRRHRDLPLIVRLLMGIAHQ